MTSKRSRSGFKGENIISKKKLRNTKESHIKAEKKEGDRRSDSTWSKSKKKRMRMLRAKQAKHDLPGNESVQAGTATKTNAGKDERTDASDSQKKSSLQASFKARLSGSRFRTLNEELYTTTSQESFARFSENPELFEQYHEGFRHQVERWPVNPVDVTVRWLTNQYRKKPCIVADFGCGDAQLAKDLLNVKENGVCNFTVHSFDLVSQNELVTAADMANVPLQNKSVDACIFCLSLMGRNLADFIREAHRVLKDNGRMKIAEVRSRIEYSHSRKGKNSKDETARKEDHAAGTIEEFTDVLKQLGFDCIRTDKSNTMFLTMELKKNGRRPDKNLEFSAKPCIYKIR